jgi:hypothetical protein
VKRILSVTEKRPTGVGVLGPPTATGKRRTTRPARTTVTSRSEMSAVTRHSFGTRRTALIGTYPRRSFGSSVAITRSQSPSRPDTASTRGESNSVRRLISASASDSLVGAARSTVGPRTTATTSPRALRRS